MLRADYTEAKDSLKKKRVNISIDEATHERLKEYAKSHHTTVSQAITNLIWQA